MKNTKEAIMNRAIELYREYGFEKAGIKQICADCGVTTGSFYHHFRSKSSVLTEYFKHMLENTDDLMPKLLTETNRFEQLWLVYRERSERYIAPGADTLRLYWLDFLENAGDLRNGPVSFWPRVDRTTDLALKLIRLGQESGEIRADRTAAQLHEYYLYTKTAALIDWATRGGDFDVIAEIRRIYEIVFSPQN